jgi:H+/Cl- antiporter ClcA
MTGMGNNPAAIMGIVVGALGMLYGWKARYFTTGLLGSSGKPREKIPPRWQDRALVVAVSGVVVLASVVALLTGR